MVIIDERDSEFTFTGSKIYLVGTMDPNHSTANVSIDGGVGMVGLENARYTMNEDEEIQMRQVTSILPSSYLQKQKT